MGEVPGEIPSALRCFSYLINSLPLKTIVNDNIVNIVNNNIITILLYYYCYYNNNNIVNDNIVNENHKQVSNVQQSDCFVYIYTYIYMCIVVYINIVNFMDQNLVGVKGLV